MQVNNTNTGGIVSNNVDTIDNQSNASSLGNAKVVPLDMIGSSFSCCSGHMRIPSEAGSQISRNFSTYSRSSSSTQNSNKPLLNTHRTIESQTLDAAADQAERGAYYVRIEQPERVARNQEGQQLQNLENQGQIPRQEQNRNEAEGYQPVGALSTDHSQEKFTPFTNSINYALGFGTLFPLAAQVIPIQPLRIGSYICIGLAGITYLLNQAPHYSKAMNESLGHIKRICSEPGHNLGEITHHSRKIIVDFCGMLVGLATFAAAIAMVMKFPTPEDCQCISELPLPKI